MGNSQFDMRQRLIFTHIKGDGIEIGALQKPVLLPDGVRVRYVDRLQVEEARKQFPELGDIPLVVPDVIDNAETLITIEASVMDFVIANHVLEHMKNPLLALQNWLRVLKRGGVLFLAVPDRMNPLDRHRSITAIQHILLDYEQYDLRATDNSEHFLDYSRSVFAELPEAFQEGMAIRYARDGVAIHFHTFSRASFEEFLAVSARLLDFEVAAIESSTEPENEHIAVLVKR